jgi:hypothetical protein
MKRKDLSVFFIALSFNPISADAAGPCCRSHYPAVPTECASFARFVKGYRDNVALVSRARIPYANFMTSSTARSAELGTRDIERPRSDMNKA